MLFLKAFLMAVGVVLGTILGVSFISLTAIFLVQFLGPFGPLLGIVVIFLAILTMTFYEQLKHK